MELMFCGDSRFNSKQPWTGSFEVNLGNFTEDEFEPNEDEERLKTFRVAQGCVLFTFPLLMWYSNGCSPAERETELPRPIPEVTPCWLKALE